RAFGGAFGIGRTFGVERAVGDDGVSGRRARMNRRRRTVLFRFVPRESHTMSHSATPMEGA
ncbi:hypothetical protein, partial [Halolamina salina]